MYAKHLYSSIVQYTFLPQEDRTVLLLLELFPPASPTSLMANIDQASTCDTEMKELVGGGGQFHRQQQRSDLPYLALFLDFTFKK
jgi:hypothetical protein